MSVERWRMQTGRIAEIDLAQSAAAVESLRALLRSQGAVPVVHEPVQAFAGDEYDEPRRLRAEQRSARRAVGAAAAGEIPAIPSHEKEANMPNDTTSTAYTATEVASALAQVDACPEGHVVTFTPEDALYQPISESFWRPRSWFGADEGIGIDEGTWTQLVCPLNAHGEKVNLPPEWKALTEAMPADVVRYWRSHANTAIRVGELLVISLGESFPIAEVDGMVEMVTGEEMKRRDRAKREAWLDDHPEVRTACALWGGTATVDDLNGIEGVDIWFEREIGPVRLSAHAAHSDGTLTFDDNTTAPTVTIDRDYVEDPTVEMMRELASALMAAIPVVETEVR